MRKIRRIFFLALYAAAFQYLSPANDAGLHWEPYPASRTQAQPLDLPFPVGVFEDAGMLNGDAAKFQSMIDDLGSRGLDSVMLTNGFSGRDQAMLDRSDPTGMSVYIIPGGDLADTWWPAEVPANFETARQLARTIAGNLSPHPSFKGYIVKDEPSLDQAQKVRLMTRAFQEIDPARPAMPVLIGLNRIGPIFQVAQPDVLLLDVYPVGASNPVCDFTMSGFGYDSLDFVSYIRAAVQGASTTAPLWLILQTHSFNQSLREPIPAELRSEQWMAVGEGARGIFWFIYSSQQGWRGLVDNPDLYAEVTALTRRILPLRDLLLTLHKSEDEFNIAGPGDQQPYASTLAGPGGERYVVAVNRDCLHNQDLTITSPVLSGELKDLETSATVPLGTPITFLPGDGKVFQFIDASAPHTLYLPKIEH